VEKGGGVQIREVVIEQRKFMEVGKLQRGRGKFTKRGPQIGGERKTQYLGQKNTPNL